MSYCSANGGFQSSSPPGMQFDAIIIMCLSLELPSLGFSPAHCWHEHWKTQLLTMEESRLVHWTIHIWSQLLVKNHLNFWSFLSFDKTHEFHIFLKCVICWILARKFKWCKMIQILWIFRQPSILNLSSWLDKQQKSRITTQLCQFSTFPLRWFLCCANPKRHSWWLYNSNLSLNKMFFVRWRRDWKSVEISFEVYRLEMIFEHCLPEEHRCEGLLKLQ